MTVELIYDTDCPNVAMARVRLEHAFAALGLAPQWQEWRRDDPGAPAYARACGSPTILVDGRDVAPPDALAGIGACRLYPGPAGQLCGVPDLEVIRSTLQRARDARTAPHVSTRQTLGTVPALGIALLPKLTCAACWPAYAGLLSAAGIGFVDYTPYLLPITAAMLALTSAMLAYRASQRHGYRPLALGVLASAAILGGKFAFDLDAALYSGIALLVGASVWNAWPVRRPVPCTACPGPPPA